MLSGRTGRCLTEETENIMPAIFSRRLSRFARHCLALSGCAILLALSQPTLAAPPVKLLGLEDMSCKAWQQSRDDADQRGRYLAWLRGFLSGHNYARQSQQVTDISSGTIAQYIDRYCSEKPLGAVNEGIARMSDAYSGRNEAISR